MLKDVYSKAEKGMKIVVENFKKELTSIRTGRANPAILERVKVDYYGTSMPVNQLATITVPEARVLLVQPWDASALNLIQKAIQTSDLGVNPTNDGKVIRIVLPELTEERRKEMVKMTNKIAESSRVAIRNIRRDAMDEVKKMEKNKEISEDEMKKGQDEIQKLTDKYIKQIDEIAAKKEAEIMEV
ncbi:ribosome recycling factor [Caldanaerobius fijiensis DSM 17918]|uniref:Ribosome-recycling factor n=1 Tax=Caldanaerobius fijiensis DSM 17918 TaxID=1121256 RepID=A0A1M4XJF4_9THEO|nr:ribosome recycling factor [Caldanaerobius fijiensis]SHE93518.1 ribosome recycling factor [Caldanaerobius fijiensis DSM 17918]